MTTDDTPLVAENGTPPPVDEGDTSPVAEDGTPPVVEDDTPPVSEIGTLPVPEGGTPPVAHGGTPPIPEGDTPPVVEDETPPVFEIGTLPIPEGGTPLVAEDGASVPEGDMPLVVETCTPAVAQDGLPVVQAATPITAGGIPPVTGDIFLGAEKGTPRSSARPHSKLTTWARRLRMFVAYVLLLAVLGAAGIAAFALVQGTWIVTPILSGSMRPGLAVGGVAISQRVRVDSLAVRDVIVFADPYKPSEQIVHRIVRITKNSSGQLLFNTQGDANTVRDPWTMTIRGAYVYRVRWTVPLIGYIAIAYQNHRGFFLLGAGIVLILIAVSTVLGTRPRRRRRHARRASQAS
ncbi:MAG: signal peptidase I [Acidimicrobiales bacterium]